MSEPRFFPPHAVAIVGFSGRFPGAADMDQFWQNLREGRESLSDVSDADMDKAGVPDTLRSDPLYVRKATTLAGAELFDAGFFGISPREAQVMDPQHRIFLECAWEALEHAGYGSSADRGVVGVYAGASMNTYLLNQILRDQSVLEAAGGYQLMLGNDKDFLCTRISYKLNLRGPSMTVQTACSTSLVAVEMACRALRHGECDMALAGGVSVNFPLQAGYLYQDGMIFSPDGHCRPFDVAAAGTRSGAGAGIVVLKRLADAIADGDTIHAVILGAAVNNDGADKIGYTAPSVDGQVEAIATAQALANVDPRTITYMEAHGTATPLGDPIEIRALTEVFRASTDEIGFCRLGSLKANLGHLDAAAGVAGLIKAVLALKHKEMPPLANFTAPNPQLNLESSPFVASAELTNWSNVDGPRRAGVSSFGIGGTNAHVVLEEAPAAASVEPSGPALLVLSAQSPAALEQASQNLAAHLETAPSPVLADAAWTLHAGRQAFNERRAVVAPDIADAVRQLRENSKPNLSGVHADGERPVVFLFSGQGSQYPGMGASLYEAEPVFKHAVDQCADLLNPALGRDIRDIAFGQLGEMLGQTRYTQPALFTIEYALAKLWESWGVVPQAMMGHSIGEYVAAHLSGVYSLTDALSIVSARGRLMQAMQPGGMAAVQLAVSELRKKLPANVEIAAINGSDFCTVAGPTPAIEAFLASLESGGVDARLLHTSHAFHSAMMQPALAEFVAAFEGVTLHAPKIPYVSNLTGTWITPTQAMSPAYYAEHLRHAVQFEAGILTLTSGGAPFVLEVGPGDALATLARLNLRGARSKQVAASLSHPRRKQVDTISMREAAAQLWLAGVKLDARGLHGPARKRVPLPTYPFQRVRYSVDGPPVSFAGRGSQVEDRSGEIRLYAPTWTRDTSPPPAATLASQSWLVFGPDNSLVRAILEGFRSAGAEAFQIEPAVEPGQTAGVIQVRPGVSEDIAQTIRISAGSAITVTGVIYAWEPTESDTNAFGALAGYQTLVRFADQLGVSNRAVPARIIVASRGGQSVFGEPVKQVDAALAFGAVLALPSELPAVAVRSVDLEHLADPENAARVLVEEAQRHDAEPFVAWRAGCRWIRRYEPHAENINEKTPIKTGGVYLITGGVGGIGLELGGWLARTASAKLILTSRSKLPPREEWDQRISRNASHDGRVINTIEAIREIERSGGEVVVATADAADMNAMRNAIERGRSRWGRIDGVIHAAGVPGAGEPSFLETEEEMQSVVSPKRGGLRVLVELLADEPLDFMVLMSSINAIAPSPNAGPYAAANAYFDSFVESDLAPPSWRRLLAINWSAWREVGMAANLAVPDAKRAERAAFLKQAIEPQAGVAAFADLLASGRRRAVVTSFDLLNALARPRKAAAGTPAANREPALANPGSDTSSAFVAPSSDVQRGLAAIWSDLLGIMQVGLDDDFFQLGGHSLLATRLLARINSGFGVRLALRDVFDARTLRGVADLIRGNLVNLAVNEEEQEEIVI